MNSGGAIVGTDSDNGFVRLTDGSFYFFLDPDESLPSTGATSINASGTMVGNYALFQTGVSGLVGFVRTREGQYTSYMAPGAISTAIYWINNAGYYTGFFNPTIDEAPTFQGFAVAPDGTTTTFLVEGETYPFGINNHNEIVGYFSSPGEETYHGFVRTAQGLITQLDMPGAASTSAFGINDLGVVVGAANVNGALATCFVYSGGTFTPFSVPGAESTNLLAIDNRGHLAGTYYDSTGNLHGFIAVPVE